MVRKYHIQEACQNWGLSLFATVDQLSQGEWAVFEKMRKDNARLGRHTCVPNTMDLILIVTVLPLYSD